MSLTFNYRHLYYFWVVAKEGGMARAAARLGMAVQTVSTQVRTTWWRQNSRASFGWCTMRSRSGDAEQASS